jgi:NitT/TauT family transport system ATP-binding protein
MIAPTTGRPVQFSVQQVRVAFDGKPVLADVTLDIGRGEFLTVFGPNGCGKTTLLNVIAGLQTPDTGRVVVATESRSRIGFVFQDYRGNLLPWLTVAENIAFPLRLRGVPAPERQKRVESIHAQYGLNVDLRARTYTLSGGQAQLASILRGLIIDPDLLILDEPFSALDYQTNLDMCDKILRVHQMSAVTVLLVSHDLDQALYLGERTVFLSRRPARVAAITSNEFAGPKELAQMGTQEFAALKARALGIFRHEAGANTR